MTDRPNIKHEELVKILAEVSHRTWMRQKSRDSGESIDKLSAEVTKHDRERAEDTIRELQRLGLLSTT